MVKLRNFFWYCSGAHFVLLEKCPSESSKYAGIGATIFFTGLFAAMSASYALFTVFDSIFFAVSGGLVWGLMIFNLDRFIVSSMRKHNKRIKEYVMALPRLFLAIVISIVIAKPLELKVFEKEIDSEIMLMKEELVTRQENEITARFSEERNMLNAEINSLKSEIETKIKSRNSLAEEARREADGTGGTMQRSAGPIYRIKKADADRAQIELERLTAVNNAQIGERYNRLADLDSIAHYQLENMAEVDLGGPASRLEALSRLTTSSTAIWWANFFIVLLFITVETAPIFVKLISSKGPYDYQLETLEYKFETANLEDKAFIHSQLKKKSEGMAATEKEFVTETLDMKLQ